jgi:Amt family ammonium transporter
VFFDKIKVDDPVGAIAVHGVNGLFGTLAVGLFAIEGGLFYGGGASLLLTQILGVSAIALFSFTLTFIIMKLLKMSIGIRISNEDEEAGIDASSFGVQSYNNE